MNLPGPHGSYRGWSIIRLFTIAALVLTVHRSPMDAQAEGATPDMALRLQQILKETPDKNLYLGTKDIRKWRAWLESPPFYAKAADKVWAMMELGIAELRYGQEKRRSSTWGRPSSWVEKAKSRPSNSENACFFWVLPTFALLKLKIAANNTPRKAVIRLFGAPVCTPSRRVRRMPWLRFLRFCDC